MPSIDDLDPGDVIEFIYPMSNKPKGGQFSVGRFIRTIRRRKDKSTDIELESSMGKKILIREDYILWDITLHHKNKKKRQAGQITLDNVE